MAIWIGVGFIALVGVRLIATYNALVALRNGIANAWKQIDVQLRRRHDLIPNLVETVKGVMRFEQAGFHARWARCLRSLSAIRTSRATRTRRSFRRN